MDTTLDHTVARLDDVVAECVAARSSLCVFPAMYRSVTIAVRDAVRAGGLFDDDARLEELTTVFAGLYLDAYDHHRAGEMPAASWDLAFEVAESGRRRMILQHLLLGMNAHINLDLGLATKRVGGDRLPSIYADFIRVNEILFHILDRLEGGLGSVSPRISLLDRVGGPWDESLMKVGIRAARDQAWRFAVRLSETASPIEQILERDADTAWLGRLIVRRWSPLHALGLVVARSESRSMVDIVSALTVTDVDFEDISRRSDIEVQHPTVAAAPLRALVARHPRRLHPRRSVAPTHTTGLGE